MTRRLFTLALGLLPVRMALDVQATKKARRRQKRRKQCYRDGQCPQYYGCRKHRCKPCLFYTCQPLPGEIGCYICPGDGVPEHCICVTTWPTD